MATASLESSDLDHLHAGIPDGAYKPVGGDNKAAATWYRKRNAEERTGQLALGPDPAAPAEWAEDFETFADLDERSPDEVQAKEDPSTLSCAATAPAGGTTRPRATFGRTPSSRLSKAPTQMAIGRVPTTNDVRDALASSTRPARLSGAATAAAQAQRFFHWALEFPDVFERGGFDVVLGNPPWDQLQPEEVPFFRSEGALDVATLSGARRKAAIAQLDDTDLGLACRWRAYKRNIEATSKFLRPVRLLSAYRSWQDQHVLCLHREGSVRHVARGPRRAHRAFGRSDGRHYQEILCRFDRQSLTRVSARFREP